MKEIFQEYGAAIIAVITGVLLLGVIFGIRHADKTGLFSIMGLSVEKQETDYTAYRDFDAVQVWHEREKPQVYYVEEKGRYFADETCGFLERYYAKDMEGALYSMNLVMLENRYPDVMFGSISDIRDAEGNSRMSYYNPCLKSGILATMPKRLSSWNITKRICSVCSLIAFGTRQWLLSRAYFSALARAIAFPNTILRRRTLSIPWRFSL